ncbi:hypothetical protein KV557_33165 [Kitasatospora aureofaciens]|uniref:hypothetical protein n=1 Tax=Kitasatospora aureofaciens TaxID=1894 RepID=UPI001C494203|nr:hypothetical protein [Kitasatospora aureofaciens]MBV6701900.1 hypothetical protein [Kitasatospora aureofaciens]
MLVLQELTEVLRDALGPDAQLTESEARDALRALTAPADPESVLDDDAAATAAARRLLTVALADPDTAPFAEPIAADPPADDQLAVEAAVTGLVLLAALVSWLQTKVDIKIHRKDGRTEFLFHLRKAAADPDTLRSVTRTATRVLTGSDTPES